MTIRRLHITGGFALAAFLGCSAGGVVVGESLAPQQAIAQDVDDAYFYSNLAPHGQWFFQTQFGWVWHPARVSAGWRPYTEGQWVWSDDVGWTWESQEPWGWATYHYGRWYFDPMYGWSWVPGRTWAPAWVSWRVEAGYIGWAPLWPVYFDTHPDDRWDRWHHDREWDHRHQGRDWDRWVFTRDRDFTSDRVGRRAITDRHERDTIYSRSRDVTQYDESHPERIGHSVDKALVEKAVGRPIRSAQIETVDKPGKRDSAHPDRLEVFRPRVRETPDKTPDRLGLAKEPSHETRDTDTIHQEKTRLENVPQKDKGHQKTAREPAQPTPREVQSPATMPAPRAEQPAHEQRPAPHAQSNKQLRAEQPPQGVQHEPVQQPRMHGQPAEPAQQQRKHEQASQPEPQAEPHHGGQPHHEQGGQPHHEQGGQPHHEQGGQAHHEQSGQAHHEQSGQAHHEQSGQAQQPPQHGKSQADHKQPPPQGHGAPPPENP